MFRTIWSYWVTRIIFILLIAGMIFLLIETFKKAHRDGQKLKMEKEAGKAGE